MKGNLFALAYSKMLLYKCPCPFPDKVSRLQDENERLKKNLSSKNEVESKQIEAVRDLSTANAQWEQVAKKTASDLEDARDQVGRKYSFHNISAPSDLLSDCNILPRVNIRQRDNHCW